MHLQKQQSRVYKGKEYPKYLIVIPPKDIEKLEWTEKDELESIIEDGKLVIEKKGAAGARISK
jgi:bifunctional DNA-binding transcriptional regulator/antitoxin component of YhaV-PrlF toxin-antitoxin module